MFFLYLTLNVERGQGQSLGALHLVFNVFFLYLKFEVLILKGTQAIAKTLF